MSFDDRLPDLLTDAARGADRLPPTNDGVRSAIRRRADRRKRKRLVAGATGVVFIVACTAAAVAVSGSDGTDPEPAPPASTPDGSSADLPLVGIDLVGFARDPALDPEPSPSDAEVTFAVFTGDEPDVLGPMMTAALHRDVMLDLVGTPVDLDGDGATDGRADGLLSTFPNGAAVSWSTDLGTAAVNGHGVSAEAVVEYARQISGLAMDHLEGLPTPDGLDNREVVTFAPQPDFESRVAAYRGPSMTVYVLTTADLGYFDLTRIVSTEGEPYEQIELGSTFLGPGAAILSPDDEGVTSALVRTDAGLTVHVFGQHLDADTLRQAIEFGHLVELAPTEVPATATTLEPATTTSMAAPTTTDPPTTSVPPLESALPHFDRFDTADGTRIEMLFGPEAVELIDPPDDQREPPPSCPSPGPTYERYLAVDVVYAAPRNGELEIEGDIALWWCAEAEATLVVIGHPATVTPTTRQVENPHRIVVDFARSG